jgi:hypothetical protein
MAPPALHLSEHGTAGTVLPDRTEQPEHGARILTGPFPRAQDMSGKGIAVSETPEQNERRHAEAPAEGESGSAEEVPDERVHAQEPAEGPDTAEGNADRRGPGAAGSPGGAGNS